MRLLALVLAFVAGAPFAGAANGVTAEGTRSSPFASFFSEGIAAGRIEIVSFPANVECSLGRAARPENELRPIVIHRSEGPTRIRLTSERAARGLPAPTNAEVLADVEANYAANKANFCGPTLRAYHFKAENPKALLLVVHGMQSNSAWFLSGETLARSGVEVLAFDRRGSGISDGSVGHVNDFNDLIGDMDSAVEFLRNERERIPMHLHANCFGTRIGIPYLQDYMESRTKTRLQEKRKRDNPSISDEQLEDVNGYRFVSVINTSPATHMSRESEKLIRDHFDCFMQFVQADKNWEPRERCLTKPQEEYPIMETERWMALLSPEEKSCLGRYARRVPEALREAQCREEHVQKLLSPDCLSTDPTAIDRCQAQLGEVERNCLDGLVWENFKYIENDKCTAADRQALRSDLRDPSGVEMVRSPLTDDLFTTEPRFLEMIGQDQTALRALSRSFFYALYDLSNRMDNWLKGRTFGNQVLDSSFGTPVLMVLQTEDRMVENPDIVHEYFSAHRGAPKQESGDLISACFRCNPKVVGTVNPAECSIEELRRCRFPQDVLECVDPTGEIAPCTDRNGNSFSCANPDQPFQQCADVRLISPRHQPRFRVPPKSIKRLVEIDCEHFTEFCKRPEETERYRRAMVEWLGQDRWQAAWDELFE